VEEGICDYLAGSYCKNISEWQWQNLFKWDGHNEFWSGRTLLSTKYYPDNLVGQIHRDGEIFSSALMNMELILGREKTHKILFSSMPFLVPNLSMPLAANVLLQTDSVLFNGINNFSISQVLISKGIHPSQIIVSHKQVLKNNSKSLLTISGSGNQRTIHNLSENSVSFFILDQNGRVLRKVSDLPSGQSFSLDASNLSPGVYFIKEKGQNGQQQVQKLIFLPD
jgi:hypothetical protein